MRQGLYSGLKHAIRIVIYLCDHRFGATPADLAEETGQSIRTVWRYVKALRDAGVQIRNAREPGHGKALFRLVNREIWVKRMSV